MDHGRQAGTFSAVVEPGPDHKQQLEEDAKWVREAFGSFPPSVDVHDPAQLLAFQDGFEAAMVERSREVPEHSEKSKTAWLAGYDDYARRKADGRVPSNLIPF